MKWKLKAAIQNVVAALPVGSDAVYFGIQRVAGGLRSDRINPLSRMKAAADIVAWARAAGIDVTGKTVLEVGTGHMIDLPTGMWLCGAERIITVDLHRYLSTELVSESRGIVRRKSEEIAEIFSGARNGLFEERLQILTGFSVPDDQLLSVMNVEYRAPADAARLTLPDSSIDLHVSYTVLEHIPPDALRAILYEARRILRPGGLLIHTIDPSDHFAHDDSSITQVNFLRFSDSEWTRWGGNRFMYHNRLRAADYVKMFTDAGVAILKEERTIDARAKYALVAGFPVDARFHGIAPEELATTTLSLVGRFDS